ncbi:MAG: hypothetical protein EU547_02270 [Promethearchaeota archaeon]|nr:MAG: hypothetical protein EU547_02270 [Candidatus Lokiarchaeota archaeon]
MIYKVFIINAKNGISILDTSFKQFKEKQIEKEVFLEFFNAINETIDFIQEAMTKGKEIKEKRRVIESEQLFIVIYYHPNAEVLICLISDAGDNIDKLKDIVRKIGNRFWKKHESDLDYYRETHNKGKFTTFKTDIEILTMEGRIAEEYPKLIVIKNVLQKIHSMGIINDFDYLIALKCTGKNSPLEISHMFDKTRMEIHDNLQKLKELEIISF